MNRNCNNTHVSNPSVSVVICTFSDERIDFINKTLHSIFNQTCNNYEIIIVVDGNDKLYKRLDGKFGQESNITIVKNGKHSGPSTSRNFGVSLAKGDIVAFIDDDAIATSDWLDMIMKNFRDNPDIYVCGGRLLPLYERGARRLPEEILWIAGCTYKGHPDNKQFVRNVISANMAVRKEIFKDIKFERMFDGKNWKMEDTLFGIMVSMRKKDAILYNPDMVVYHNVTKDRTKLNYILQRAYSEGILKAKMSKYVNNMEKVLSNEQNYLIMLLTSIMKRTVTFDIMNSVLLSLVTLSTVAGYAMQKFFNVSGTK